jgi:hypothetical protein
MQSVYVVIVKLLSLVAASVSILALGATPLLNAQPEKADDAENPAFGRVYVEFRTVFLRHYPKATCHLVKQNMHFEHNTRTFIVHEPLKTGEWQDPWETRGPQPGGILCEIVLQAGRYQGAAVVPQTFDKRYFKVLLLAPYSAKHDRHLSIQLSYPANVNSEFLKEFTDLANDFPQYLD